MSDTVIEVENLSKQYSLGEVSTGTLSHDLNRWWHRMRGREDPYLKLTQANVRDKRPLPGTHARDYVWALRDIGFEVRQGDVLGIIGRNGAGKSTLLKILSRITAPTTGEVRIKGRVSSLLEVGTGFHPDLTGRENIYLNGAILGMTKAEIRGKLDEIAEFSGCTRYLDTPVKRYSSGMIVRLGFAVAAHLEQEILIVDEVLAVGDYDFQRKCIGKMSEVAGLGRTVLFVSHNMAAISKLCHRGLLLHEGTVQYAGSAEDAISRYLDQGHALPACLEYDTPASAPGDAVVRLKSVRLLDHTGQETKVLDIRQPAVLEMQYWKLDEDALPTAIFHLKDEQSNTLFATNEFNAPNWKIVHQGRGLVTARCHLPGNFLAEGLITVLAAINTYNPTHMHVYKDDAISFEVVDHSDGDGVRGPVAGYWPGLLRPWLDWETHRADSPDVLGRPLS